MAIEIWILRRELSNRQALFLKKVGEEEQDGLVRYPISENEVESN